MGCIYSKWIVKIGFCKLIHLYLKYSDCSTAFLHAIYWSVCVLLVICLQQQHVD